VPLSSPQQWVNSLQRKDIISGLAPNTQFRIGACCFSPTGGDTTWSGTLHF
jgi:hypothetical protein